MSDDSSDTENDDSEVSISSDDDTTSSDDSLLRALKQRQEEVEKGIGKRYITRTQKGFLNVHEQVRSACLLLLLFFLL